MSNVTRLKPPEEFDFPFAPYRIQDDFMRRLYEVIEDKRLGIFESPTGTVSLTPPTLNRVISRVIRITQGKSLSIICGALRWLKDHDASVRDSLVRRIHDLEEEKSKLVEEAHDWLANQARKLEIDGKLRELKTEQKRIADHDGKIEVLKRERNVIEKRRRQQFESKENAREEVKNDAGAAGDYFLEDPPSEGDDSDSDEDAEEKFHSVKVILAKLSDNVSTCGLRFSSAAEPIRSCHSWWTK